MVDTATRLRVARSAVRTPDKSKIFSLHREVQIGSGAHAAFYPMDNGDPSQG